jgi:DNA-binding NarL/FixJ family response regulator
LLENTDIPPKKLELSGVKFKIVLADDNEDILYLIKEILEPEFEVVATARDGPELLIAVEDFKPDVIILDINMPGMSGFEAMKRILEEDIDARIILLTAHKDRMLVEKGISAGAKGFVLKFTASEDLVPAVNEICQGNIYISPSI